MSMRALLFLLPCLLLGCDRSPCAGIAGTCLSLEISEPLGAGLMLDQVTVQVGAQRLLSRSAPTPLPIALAISFPQNAQGPYALIVEGYLDQHLLGRGQGQVEIMAGRKQSLGIGLQVLPGPDGGTDAGAADLSIGSRD